MQPQRRPGPKNPVAFLLPRAQILGLPAARLSLLLGTGLAGVALVAGALRILPLLVAPGVPLALGPILFRGALGMALETALFVAPALGWSLTAARLVDRGEARALMALGVSPARLLVGSSPLLGSLGLAAGLAAALWGREAAAPGRAIGALLDEARAACAAAPPPAAVPVPLTGISWICLPGEPPRAVGVMPIAGIEGTESPAFAAGSIALSDDLRAFSARELVLLVPARSHSEAHAGQGMGTIVNDGNIGEVRLSATEATIHGVPPLGRASNLRPLPRALLLAASSALLALVAGGAVLIWSIRGRALALALGLAGPACALMAFSTLEREAHGATGYALVPLAGLAGIGVVLAGMAARAAIGRRRARVDL
ncbi:MAG: hypothetical protein U0359_04505 [Byssovorax sp.]